MTNTSPGHQDFIDTDGRMVMKLSQVVYCSPAQTQCPDVFALLLNPGLTVDALRL